ncbi:hypothetical protein MLD38_026086 [Melastoma candidum]|uniref:Uncharacterized protein n=1 Tax=Melastoma candidum TaxID=119954 RepID=A0ACB9NXC9_9MYRT|nr:hypothetical protein MLD38_026086 [Melastoma candidum]
MPSSLLPSFTREFRNHVRYAWNAATRTRGAMISACRRVSTSPRDASGRATGCAPLFLRLFADRKVAITGPVERNSGAKVFMVGVLGLNFQVFRDLTERLLVAMRPVKADFKYALSPSWENLMRRADVFQMDAEGPLGRSQLWEMGLHGQLCEDLSGPPMSSSA